MDEIFSNVIDKTFSIAVSAFLLLRMEREMKLLRASIDRLRHCSTCSLSPLNDDETKKLWKAYAADEEAIILPTSAK